MAELELLDDINGSKPLSNKEKFEQALEDELIDLDDELPVGYQPKSKAVTNVVKSKYTFADQLLMKNNELHRTAIEEFGSWEKVPPRRKDSINEYLQRH